MIVSLDGEQIESVEAFLGALRRHDVGDRLTVEVLRDNERLTFEVTLTERQA